MHEGATTLSGRQSAVGGAPAHMTVYSIRNIVIYSILCCGRFLRSLRHTAKLSDRIGYIYWVAVLTTITFGLATGVLVTLQNRQQMIGMCREKLQFYGEFSSQNNVQLAPGYISEANDEPNESMAILEAYEFVFALVVFLLPSVLILYN